MTAITTIETYNQTHFKVDLSKAPIDQCEELREHLGLIVAETMQSIAQETAEVSQKYEQDTQKLKTAIWYPSNFAKACKKTKNFPLLEFMQKKGHLKSGYLSNKHFEIVYSSGRRLHWTWILKEGSLPSEALLAARKGLSILDCGTVCTIAHYTALLGTLGAEKFNRLFSHAHGIPLFIDYADHSSQPMTYFVRFTDETRSHKKTQRNYRDIKCGQIVSFNNYVEYSQRHINGMGSNYNICCLSAKAGEQKFVGHGIPAQGLTEEEMCEFLAKIYNKPPEGVLRASSEKEQDSLKNLDDLVKKEHHKPIMKSDVPGLDVESYQDFNINLILALIKLPLEKTSMEYVKRHEEAKASRERVDLKESFARLLIQTQGCLNYS